MTLFLEIIEGEGKGQSFRLNQGLRIGRTIGEVIIKDPKASSLHAQVEKDEKEQLILIDKNSSNGLRVNGQRVKKVAMLPGVIFGVGKTLLKVVQREGKEEASNSNSFQNWRALLLDKLPRIPGQNRTTLSELRPFDQAVQLKFIEGLQAGTILVLGYGPRKFGSDVLDVELQEPTCPDIAFVLTPEGSRVRFQTQFPQMVQLNQQPTFSEILSPGDRIQIGTSLIEVTFIP